MASFPTADGRSLSMDTLPDDVRIVAHEIACLLDKYGVEWERATDTGFAGICWICHVANCWGQVCVNAKVETKA